MRSTKPGSPFFAPLLWLLAALLAPALVDALENDRQQPIYIEADSVDIDESKGVSVYQGDVVLTQGTIKLTAQRITVTQQKGESDQVEALGAPVHFQQQSADKGLIKGQARKAEYDVDSELLVMSGDAELKQGQDTFKSDRIVYDRAKSKVQAGAAAQGSGRVRITIQSPK